MPLSVGKFGKRKTEKRGAIVAAIAATVPLVRQKNESMQKAFKTTRVYRTRVVLCPSFMFIYARSGLIHSPVTAL